jgi:hypothetical protein
MRYILIFWGAPMGFFWGWYFLSLNDFSGGTGFFSRKIHDLVFTIYGNVLGMDPAVLPGLVARACVFDTFLIFGILAFRRRKKIMEYVRSMRAPVQEVPREIA